MPEAVNAHRTRYYRQPHRAVILAEQCDVMCKTAREIGTRSTMSDNQQTTHCVDVSLTARSFSVLSVSLPRIEVVVQLLGDDKTCRLEPRRWGWQEHYDSTTWSLRKQTYVSNRAKVIRQMLSPQVEWPENTEILLADMPPSTASEVFSFFDNMSGLLGCLIVTQPSEISALGMRHTVYLLKLLEGPIAETMRRAYSPFIAPGGHRLCWPICHHLLPVRFFPSLTTCRTY